MAWFQQQVRRIGRRSLLAGLALLVALPVYGPLIIPNYLKWQHYHTHIFLGEVEFEHSHDLTTTCPDQLPDGAPCAHSHHHTVSLPRLDGFWQIVPYAGLPLAALAITPQGQLLASRPTWYYGLAVIWLQPPDKPPRFLSLVSL